MINHTSVNETNEELLKYLLNAALKAKNLTNSSQSRKYSNCMSIDLKLEDQSPTIQKSQYVFSYSYNNPGKSERYLVLY